MTGAPLVERGFALVLSAYLALCLLLGGASREGALLHAVLIVFAIAIIVACWMLPQSGRSWRGPLTVQILLALLAGFYLAPLPPELWQQLPGRDSYSRGFAMFGLAGAWQPISLMPAATAFSLSVLLPPLAVYTLVRRVGDDAIRGSVVVFVVVALISLLLGIIQVSGSGYLYDGTGRGNAVGFFANANHLATLLAIALPFTLALLRESAVRRRLPELLTKILMFAVPAGLAVGIVLTRSIAGIVLLLFVLPFAVMIARPGWAARVGLGLVGLALCAGAVAAALGATVLITSPAGAEMATMREVDRHTIFGRSLSAAGDFFPVGSGPGSFETVYPVYENPAAVNKVFVNHVHNDYIELVLETGLIGVALVIAAVALFTAAARRAWRGGAGRRYARAGSIALAVVIIHSAVDYPGRTIAISAAAALALGLALRPPMAPEIEAPRNRKRRR